MTTIKEKVMKEKSIRRRYSNLITELHKYLNLDIINKIIKKSEDKNYLKNLK